MRWIAHRGYSARYPGNTMPAFAAVLAHPDAGVRLTGIELDVRLTADGRLAIYHDCKINCNGVEREVESLTYTELVKAARSRLGGEAVPALEEVLALTGRRLDLLIEIKAGPHDRARLLRALDVALDAYRPVGRVCLHSFAPDIMRDVARHFHDGGIRFGALVWKAADLREFEPDLLERMHSIHPYWRGMLDDAPEFVTMRKPLNVWTVNEAATLAGLKGIAGAAEWMGVITDDLRLMEHDPV